MLDSLDDLQVLVVAGSEEWLKQLEANDLIDYIEELRTDSAAVFHVKVWGWFYCKPVHMRIELHHYR